MAAKGYTRVDGPADRHIAIHAKKHEWFDGGPFKVEALEGVTGEIVWRGKAEGAIVVQSAGKRQKLAQRAVKEIFEKFPDKRANYSKVQLSLSTKPRPVVRRKRAAKSSGASPPRSANPSPISGTYHALVLI